jgi:hypothetical protein
MAKSGQHPSKSYLTLGWKTDSNFHPSYWLGRTATEPVKPAESDLFRIPSDAMGCHTVIVAKSGSGKSFFLGRLIEEIALKTKANFLILDPNADFRRIHQVEKAKLWQQPKYDIASSTGVLPTEASRKDFAKPWSRVRVRILTGERGNEYPYEEFKFWWPDLDAAFLTAGLSPLQANELSHCHAFVRVLARLSQMKEGVLGRRTDFLSEADTFLTKSLPRAEFREVLEREFRNPVLSKFESEMKNARGVMRTAIELRLREYRETFEDVIGLAVQVKRFVSKQMVHYYFSKVLIYKTQEILADRPLPRPTGSRIAVIDIPSIIERNLAVNTSLNAEWKRAKVYWSRAIKAEPEKDERVPTFVVVDEAHNLMPAMTTSRTTMRVREQFRRIAAEGRKFGLFLIIASQRPDKLDPYVVSECDNKAVMQLDSNSILADVKKRLGLDEFGAISKCLSFGPGRVIIAGHWSPEPQVLYVAARRTKQGGRNLRADYWATPYVDVSPLKVPHSR